MNMILFSARQYDSLFFEPLCGNNNIDVTFVPTALTNQTVSIAQGFDVVCVFVNDVVDKEVLQTLKEQGTKLVALRCAGYNHCDVEFANQIGLPIVRVPAYSPYSVAEHTFALILGLIRKIPKAFNRVREGNFELDGLMGFDLYQKTIGVVGAGNIGDKVIRIAQGFGMKVLVHDPVLDPSTGIHFESVELDQLIRESDIISLHCPLNSQTHYMIDAESIAKMKEGVIIINTSRGGLVDTDAIVQGLKSRKIGGLGIDVYENEAGMFFEDMSNEILSDDVFMRLLTFPNVIVTGHQGFFTRDALQNIATTTITNVLDFHQGLPLLNQIQATSSAVAGRK